MTSAYSDLETEVGPSDVYVPQEDSQFLIDIMEKTGLAQGSRVADLCTGTGMVAIAACEQGASQVTAFDICPRAVHCARIDARGGRRRCFRASRLMGAGGRVRPVRPGGLQSAVRAP